MARVGDGGAGVGVREFSDSDGTGTVMRVWAGLCVMAVVGVGAGAQELHPRQDPVVRSAAPAALLAPATRETARPGNGDLTYRELRGALPSGPGIAVDKVVLTRDAGEITLLHGAVYPYGDMHGRCVGAVFLGEGSLHVVPPSAMERKQLQLVMKSEVLDQRFTSAVLRFTDGTWEELKKSGGEAVAGSAAAMSQATEAQTLFRKEIRYDVEARLLEDEGAGGGGFFLAEMKGPLFSKRLIYVVDPRGAVTVEPEEVEVLTAGGGSFDVALAFRSEAGKREGGQKAFRIGQQTIDTTIERNGRLSATALSLVTAERDGVRTLPLHLFPTLRVSGVWGPGGEALDFVQEDKERDADFAVVLKRPLAKGQSIQIMTAYAGPDAVLDEGNGNYFPVARENWYPNVRGNFGNYAFYQMTFHTPKQVAVIATGDRVAESDDGKVRTSRWETLTPIPVAGFNLGEFRSDQSEANKDLQVVSYANVAVADNVGGLAGGTRGTLSTVGMLKRATSEADAAIQVYTAYFGPLPYDHVSVTQQAACSYGQSWPMLVYLPVCYFWDKTAQHETGLLERDPSYWNVVTAHEVAHQWWGSVVGFGSYRDQWMSEGFADFSAALYLLETRKDMKEYREFWALLRRRLLEKNAMGVRPVDVGSVVMGGRVDTSRSGGDVYQMLVYPKGAYILHMLEMMYWTPQYGQKPFQAAMHDFMATYRNRPATTEDFKAVMERNLPPWLDLDRNHRLDWFFDAYVYGTEIPHYAVTSEFAQKGDEVSVHIKLTQSGVSSGFKMMVPLYVEMEDKQVKLLGHVAMQGSATVDQTLNLGKMAGQPKRILANCNYDVLSE